MKTQQDEQLIAETIIVDTRNTNYGLQNSFVQGPALDIVKK